MNDDRFKEIENKATEIRKILLGALLFAKDIWKGELEQNQEGIEVIKTMEQAEEAFINSSLTDSLEKLEDVIDVIHKRAKGIYTLMEYVSKHKK
jgi:uncharacterized protein involved in tolerance to divalent cations